MATRELVSKEGGGGERCGNQWFFGGLESDSSVGLAGGMLGEKLCRQRGVKGCSDGLVVSSLDPRGWSR